MRVRTIAVLSSLFLLFAVTRAQAQVPDYSACEQVVTNENRLAGVFSCDTFATPSDPLENRAWLIYPQFLWADFASLPEDFGTAFIQSQDQLQGLTVAKIRLTRFLLTGETVIEFPSSTNTVTLAASTGYSTNNVDSASRSALSTWRQWISWGEIDPNTTPTLSLDVALADVQDKPAYDAALAAEDAACAEASALTSLGNMLMSDSEGSGGDEFGIESFDPCSTTNFFIFGISKNVDSWMKLTWTSQSNALYTVQYAEQLTTNTVWLSAIENYPSQGCSTMWSDAGDLLAIPPRERPKDITKRFYRVTKSETLTNGVPNVSVSIYSNDTVNGIITFEISASVSTNRDIERTSIYIDGVWYGDAFDSLYRITVDTRRLLNGTHTVFATADDSGSDVEPGETSSDGVEPTAKSTSSPLSLTTSNSISDFSVKYVHFQPALGQTQEISAVLSAATNWVVNIKKASTGDIIRSFSGSSASVQVLWDGTESGGLSIQSIVPSDTYDVEVNVPPSVSMYFPPTIPIVIGNFGTAGVMWQGHHPGGSAYSAPKRYPGGPNIQFSSTTQPPWHPLKSSYDIGKGFSQRMQQFGYTVPLYKKDDEVSGADLRYYLYGGSNSFNSVNIGFFIGHAAAAKANSYEGSIGYPVCYIPIWNSKSSTVDWVSSIQSQFGSTNLHWMAFLVCNYLRDAPRDDAIYEDMRNHGTIPMNPNLHVLCAYKTEAYLRAIFPDIWVPALMGFAGLGNSTVIQAWEYARGKTQPGFPKDFVPNKARSTYWPECFGDHVLGYGSQTDPDPGNTQDQLMEYDTP